MPPAPLSARLTIDLDALAQNYAAICKTAATATVAPVVKADGYGLGAVAVSRRLWTAGARQYFVARISEGEALREGLGSQRPAVIYVLDGAPPGSAPRLFASNLTPVLNSAAQISEWGGLGRSKTQASKAALQIDTGMNRLGLRIEEACALAQSIDAFKGLDIDLVMSHLACATEPDHHANKQQLAAFTHASALFPKAKKSLANSGGVFLGRDYHFDMVRPGISLYGGGPFGVTHSDLACVASLHAPVLQVRSVRPGESIGYGAEFTAQSAIRIAIIAAGYADGVLRAFAKDGHVWFGNATRKVLGRISMDMIAIQIGDDQDVQPGDMVELLGPHMGLDATADASGTIAYECLVRLAPRLQRIYHAMGAQ